MASENRWDQVIPLDFEKIRDLKLQNADLEYLCKLDLTEISPEFEYARLRELLEILQQGLRKSVVDREAALYAKGRADQLLAESRRVDSPVGPPGTVQPDVIRARDQHILYLQYEVSQRDLQMQQLEQQAQQSQSQIAALEEQKRLLQEEVQHVRGQISKSRDESDQLRQSIDHQLKRAEAREKLQTRNDELIDALEESANLRLETQRLSRVCAHVEDQLRDAVVQIDNATAEHLRLKELVESMEITCEELQDENSELQVKLSKSRPEDSSGLIPSPEPSQSISSADDQLDQLISAVNKRVDEWKVLMQNQTENSNYNAESAGNTRGDDVGELERLLAVRGREVSVLRSSLTSAVHEIEEGANTITRLKQQGRRVSVDNNIDLRTQLSQRTSELSSMLKRTLALEDDLDVCQRENKELNFQVQRYEQGVYGLREARSELKNSQNQLLSRDKYIKELVRRLNFLTSDYDVILVEMNEVRRKSGLPPRQPGANRNMFDLAPLLEGKLLIEVLEDQIDHLEDERISLRRVIHSLTGNEFPASKEPMRQNEKSRSSYPPPDKTVDGLLDDLRTLRQNFDGLVEENGQLEQGMQEILDAIRDSRVHQLSGDSVELRSPSLEKLLKLMERRRLPSSDSAHTDTRLDSAVYSEPDNSQTSNENSILRDKLENVLIALDGFSTRAAARQKSGREATPFDVSNLSQMVVSLFNRGIQDVLKLVLDSDPRSLEKLIHNHQQEIQLLLDDSVGTSVKGARDYETQTSKPMDRFEDSRNGRPDQEARRSSRQPTPAPRHPDLTEELRDAEIRLARAADTVTSLTGENHRLRGQLAAASGKSFLEITEGLTSLEKDHRNEVDTLSRINADLRADARRHEIHLADLRAALQTANERLVDLTVEIKHTQSRPADDAGRGDTRPPDGVTAGAEQQNGDGLGVEVRQRVIAQLEAKIQRLEQEMRHRDEDRQKDRDEFVEILMKSGKALQSDVEFSKQVAVMNSELGQKDRQIEILAQQLDLTKLESQEKSDKFARREEELRKERENVEYHYEKTAARLRDELNDLKRRATSSGAAAAPDTGRTFTQPDGTVVPAAAAQLVPESRLIRSLSDQLADKEQELRKVSTAFQTFKEEMTSSALPSSDPTVISQLAVQKREMQARLQAAQEAHAKVLADWRKQKVEASSMLRDMNDLRTDSRQKDEQLRRFETMNGELSAKIASLENDLHRARNGLTDDDRTVAALKKRLAQAEKALADLRSKSPVRETLPSTTKPEVLVWEEKKKWEKIVQKLREKLKDNDTAADTLQATIASTREAYKRSERDRGLMEKRLASLSKRVADLSRQPSFLQQSLVVAHKEIDDLKAFADKQTEERQLLEERISRLLAQERNYGSALHESNERLTHVLQNEKTVSQKHDLLRERSQKKIKLLQQRVMELDTTIAETKAAAADISIPEDVSKDMATAVRTLKDVIDDQQAELRSLKKQNAALKAVMRQTEQGRIDIQRLKKVGLRDEESPREEKTSKTRPIAPEKSASSQPRQQKRKIKPDFSRDSDAAAGDTLQLRRDLDIVEERDEGISISKDYLLESYDPNRRVAELELQLANILGQPLPRKDKSGSKRRQ